MTTTPFACRDCASPPLVFHGPGSGNPIASLESTLIQEGSGATVSRAFCDAELLLLYRTRLRACRDAKKVLLSHGIPFEERDICRNPDYLRILTGELDSRTTPTLVLAGKIIVGFAQAEYEVLARNPGMKLKTDGRSRA